MRIKEGQIFNLMDTNGRRNDVINALQGYLTILDDIQNEQKMNWASMPESLAQYEFYRQAIELSPEVFGKHGPYDKLAETLERNKDFATAVQTQDMEWIQKNSFMFQSLVKQFDLGIEDRARHYTSNLVKLGFTDEGREISPVGELLLDLKKLRKDDLETMLPIDGVNIVYLRQLMKLRLFDTEGERYYSPFNLAIFALLKRHRLHSYYDCYAEYEEGINSFYCDVTSLSQILEYYEEETKQVEDNIQKEFPGATIEEIPVIVADKRRKEFAEFIDKNYPAEKVKEILGLFSNRSNDKLIKDIVSPDATVPTIYEYVVGIAWYYFSGKRVDILSSYNLTLSANFEPLVHAGGGQGDIVIYEADKVIMLEATLMNASSQKRGEWEPVLRHSINLKVEEETANTGREVTSFFIADSFDYNTINIWKAVAAVPLQSSNDKDKFTDNVVIMPVNTDELSSLIDKSSEYDEIISKVHKLFEVDKINFDIEWREKFMGAII